VMSVSAAGVWLRLGRPPMPVVPSGELRALARSRALLILAVVVALALAYVLALIVGTPPNGWDPLNYHLARAAFWVQSGHVGYIDAAYDERLNFNPPNGEAGLAFVLGVTRTENLAQFVQFFAALACALGVFAFARRLGLRRIEAAFGALLLLTLPIVLLQASGVKNDIVVASFLLSASVFVLGNTRGEIGLASVATALAIGTKFTAAYGLAVLLTIALTAGSTRLRLQRVAGLAIGACVGAYWYLVNAVETSRLLGDQSNTPGLTAPLHPRENLLSAYGLAVDTLDLSGAKGKDVLLYLAAAVVVTIALALLRTSWKAALMAGAIVASPLVLLVLSEELGRPGLIRLYDFLGEPKGYVGAGDAIASSPTTASDTGSWFGPAGFLLTIGGGIAAFVYVRRGALSQLARIAAVAPALWFVLVALTLTYHPWQGRFFVFPIALSAALWGLVLRARPLAWSVVALAAVTGGLALVHYAEKPSGLRLLDRTSADSVWDLQRWQVQSLHDPATGPLFQFVDDEVPRNASVALALGANEFGYPVFGPHLDRRIVLVPFGSDGRDIDATWLEADAARAAEINPTCWRLVFRAERGRVFRRVRECPGT
jgi:hypothetical protein